MRWLIMSHLIRIYTVCHSVSIYDWVHYLEHWLWPNSKMEESTSETQCRLAPVVSAFSFCHSLSLSVAVFVSLIPFHCFTIFSTMGHNLSNLYSCTRLYAFEKKKENDRKDRVWRQTKTQWWKPEFYLQLKLFITTLCPSSDWQINKQSTWNPSISVGSQESVL